MLGQRSVSETRDRSDPARARTARALRSSLQAQRSNPVTVQERLDCFVARAPRNDDKSRRVGEAAGRERVRRSAHHHAMRKQWWARREERLCPPYEVKQELQLNPGELAM